MPDLTRRTALLASGLAVPAAAATPWSANATPLLRGGRPQLGDGVQSGDVTAHQGTVWTRADRRSRMLVEVSERPDFRHARLVRGPLLTADSDFTGKTVLHGLRPGRDYHYRVIAEEEHRHGATSRGLVGRLRTAPATRSDVRFVWSGDLGGQGYGINPDIGGYRIFGAMGRLDPDFYLCNGDNVYADDPIPATQPAPDGTTWRSLTSPAKDKVAETLDEYRGQYRYNLMDHELRRFYARTPQIQQWDDHETHNNWYPGEILDDPLYTERRVDVLKQRANQAWHEYTPIAPRFDREGRIYRVVHHGPLLDVFVLDMRWYRDANSPNRQTANDGGILGFEQAAWLKRELKRSRATWKVISNDMPLTEVVTDSTQGKPNFEAVAQGDNGAPRGREIQIADLLSFIKRQGIRNTVWLTTDVHYTAAHYFDPSKAAYTDFDPFWQFTSGPLNAGSFPADATDTTFGAQQVFVKAPTTPNSSPATEFAFFGEVRIDGGSRAMTVNLRDHAGTVLWSKELPAAR
ncbi:alkaline phosphatase [Nocardioides mangrovicus]|uniref:Alkaline phosphatase n=1 Tax=Nocardioides mangrovicus TaxID=2478913 RepID=A0A3L8NY16_9ACTN|nr:alkaline phosphatase D family protein [Nocardioides mangrovicus]RLV48055.1 alkaline phosphatase [Nocardioides mangrovicus]